MADVASPVRILSLTHAEDRHVNAQQVNAREIARRLDPAGFRVTLLSDGSGPASVMSAAHVRTLQLPRRGSALRILRLLLRGEFDLLLYPGPGLPEAIYLRLPRWAPGRGARVLMPVEGDVHQLDEVPAWLRRRVDRLLRRADVLFPITEHVAEGLRARTGRSGEVVPVGVDLVDFHPREGPRALGPMQVLCVGTVKAWKRPELARAAAQRFPNARFTWIGDGDLRVSEANAAPPNLTFTGEVARDTLPGLYRQADLFLHPSRVEGLPKVILEALACGLPVIAFDTYRPTFVSDGGAGVIVKSPEEMLQALGQLLSDDTRRATMQRAARAVAERFSWDAVAQRWAAIFLREAGIARGLLP